MIRFLSSFSIAALLGALAAPALGAQTPGRAGFSDRYNEIVGLSPLPDRVAEVSGLVLRRDAGVLTLERGQLYPLTPVGGRTVGAVFRGTGRFTFTPRDPGEQFLVRRVVGAPAVDAPFTSLVLLFTDSTADQLGRLTFTRAEVPGGVRDDVRDLLRSLTGDKEGTLLADVLGPLLNGDSAGLFLARVDRTGHEALLFQVNRGFAEAVQLFRPANRRYYGLEWKLVSQFAARDQPVSETRAWRYRRRLDVTRYVIDAQLAERFGADLSLTASAQLDIAVVAPTGPWLSFALDPKLEVDSARWGSGEPARPYKADEHYVLWVLAPRALAAGDSLRLTVYYRGNMIDRYADFFYVDPGSWWYPDNRQGSGRSRFDVTFRSPARYPLVASGVRVDSSLAGQVVTTRWVTSRPAQSATFNLGLFRNRRVQEAGRPTIDVMLSEEAHAAMVRDALRAGIFVPEQRNMSQVVGTDISNSLALFTTQYGPPPDSHFVVTEIPYNEGVSFEGLIHLSWGTFQETSIDGFDEFFRAHEAAHQWWGNAIEPATYRDAWLSEGLATYSGLSYLQNVKRRNNEYFDFLDDYRDDIFVHRDENGPIAIGYRNSNEDNIRGYHNIVYLKGAWVMHMLRVMMMDLGTMRAERFTAMLADYYRSFSGVSAGTWDFASVAERHLGQPLQWFFEQWVLRPEIPTYRWNWQAVPADSNKWRVQLTVRQEKVPADFRMPVLVAVDLGNDRIARFRVPVHGGQTEYLSPLLPARPREVTFNDLRSVLAEVRRDR